MSDASDTGGALRTKKAPAGPLVAPPLFRNRSASADDAAPTLYFATLHARAVEGDGDALNALATAYFSGHSGVAPDKEKAVYYWRMAADRGHPSAQCSLGLCLFKGEGVEYDDDEALRLFRLAADQGDAKAEVCLGRVYELGDGVAEDAAAALEWYERAAAKGDETAKAAIAKNPSWAAAAGGFNVYEV